MLKNVKNPGNLICFNVVRGTPRTILNPPRHFLDKNRSRKYFRQQLLLTTSNDPLEVSQMLANNRNIFQKMSKGRSTFWVGAGCLTTRLRKVMDGFYVAKIYVKWGMDYMQ